MRKLPRAPSAVFPAAGRGAFVRQTDQKISWVEKISQRQKWQPGQDDAKPFWGIKSIGDYRIVYEIADAIRIVRVNRVRHRRDAYR